MGKWSVAWRVHDAQFWGVPQRRQRIALVADFAGLSAPEILFERKGLSGNFDEGGTQGQGITGTAKGGIGKTSEPILLESNQNHATVQTDGISTALPASMGMGGGYVPMVLNDQGGQQMSISKGVTDTLRPAVYRKVRRAKSADDFETWEKAKAANTINTFDNGDVRATNVAVYDARGNGSGQIAPTITGNHNAHVSDYTAICIGNGQLDQLKMSERVGALNCMHDQQAVIHGSSVRRLTPLECERLQGFPDGWTDIGEWTDSKGKTHESSDSARYKALGNSIALPFWKVLAKRISAQYDRDITLGSLFDGIGGFPLVFEQINGRGTARWASEIEEFPIAVTKVRFPE